MTTTVTATTTPLTKDQARHLNMLATANSDLVRAAQALVERATDIVTRAKAGQHLTGFDSDVLGQPGREVQHLASRRAALLDAALPIDAEAITYAVSADASWMTEGQTFPKAQVEA